MDPMRQKTKRPLLSAILILTVVCGVFAVAQSPWAQDALAPKSGGSKPKAPPISWTPDHLSLDGNDTVTIILTAQSAIPATSLEFVPELAPYLTVSPHTLPALAKGAARTIQIVANVPAGTPMDTIDGTLHVRAGSSTFAKPLPLTLELWPSLTDSENGLVVHYPPSWTNLGGLIFSNVTEFSPIIDSLASDESYFSVSRGQGRNPGGLSINQWFEENIIPLNPSIVSPVTEVTVDGFPALRLVTADGAGPYVRILVAVGHDIVSISHRDYTPQFDNDYQAIISSIKLAE